MVPPSAIAAFRKADDPPKAVTVRFLVDLIMRWRDHD
jgi:hypothetical protein